MLNTSLFRLSIRRISIVAVTMLSGLSIASQSVHKVDLLEKWKKLDDQKINQDIKSLQKLGIDETSVVLLHEDVDDIGFVHQRYQQLYKNLPIALSDFVMHYKESNIHSISGAYYKIEDFDIKPRFKWHEVRTLLALPGYLNGVLEKNYSTFQVSEPTLMIFIEHQMGQMIPRLTYQVEVSTAPHDRTSIYIDSATGKIIAALPQVYHCFANQPVDTTLMALTYYDDWQPVKVKALGPDTLLWSSDQCQIYDLQQGTNYAKAHQIISHGTHQNSIASQAYFATQKTYDYFYNIHDRQSYDDLGTTIQTYINYHRAYANAFWDGRRMTFGSGNEVTHGPVVTCDISGHEISHGVISHSAGLAYMGESGAINESFADIFGEMVEHYALGNNNWVIGDQTIIQSHIPSRSLSDPKSALSPDTYQGEFWINPHCDRPRIANDFCGVHKNSGVQNKWFYLLSVGGEGTNDNGTQYHITGIGIEKAAQIAYRNLTVYLYPTADYHATVRGSLAATIDLFGAESMEYDQVVRAWKAVGLIPDVTPVHTEIIADDATLHLDSVHYFFTEVSCQTSPGYDQIKYYLDYTLIAGSSDTYFKYYGLSPNREYSAYAKVYYPNDTIYTDTITWKTPILPQPHISLSLDSLSSHKAHLSWRTSHISTSIFHIYNNDRIVDFTDQPSYELSINRDLEQTIWIAGFDPLWGLIISDTIRIEGLAPHGAPIQGYYFEEGLDNWSTSNDPQQWYQGNRAAEGNGAMLLRGGKNEQNTSSKILNLSTGDTYLLRYQVYPWSMEGNDSLSISLSCQNQNIIQNYHTGIFDMTNNIVNSHTVLIEDLPCHQPILAFHNLSSALTDHCYIDAVEVFELKNQISTVFDSYLMVDEPQIYPNPAADYFIISLSEYPAQLSLYAADGQLVWNENIEQSITQLSCKQFARGYYTLRVATKSRLQHIPVILE